MKIEANMLRALHKKLSKYFPSTPKETDGPKTRSHDLELIKIYAAT